MDTKQKVALGVIAGLTLASVHMTNQLGYYISTSSHLRSSPPLTAQMDANDILARTNSLQETVLHLGDRYAAKNYLNP